MYTIFITLCFKTELCLLLECRLSAVGVLLLVDTIGDPKGIFFIYSRFYFDILIIFNTTYYNSPDAT